MNNNIINLFRIDLIILIFSLLASCKNSDDEVKIPQDLSIQVQLAEDGSGEATVFFTSENTNFYKVDFGISGQSSIKVFENKASYKYTQTGSYTITVQAHSTESEYISKSEEIFVSIRTEEKIPGSGYEAPLNYEGMTLVWQDEFEGEQLNQDVWSFETGTGANGWGNNELQYYRKENTAVKEGYLTITAQRENYQGKQYTSSRIITKGRQEFQYGRIDIRANLPKGQGIWPALWMLGSNFLEVGWPRCGEIDIMEMIGGAGKDNTVHGTVHWDQNGQYASYGGHYTKSSGILADDFHVYSIIWNSTSITWLIDNEAFHVIDITPAALSEFHQKFFFIFNVAVGGNWPGAPNDQTKFPQKMTVDYVRVFQEQ